MNQFSKNQDYLLYLENIESKQISLQDSLMKELDQIFKNYERILRIFREFLPLISESSIEILQFSIIITNLNEISTLMDHNKIIYERNNEIFKMIQVVLAFPYKSVEKFSYLTKMQPPLLFSHDHVTDDDFDRSYFYKLTLDPIYKMIESFRSLIYFPQSIPNLTSHHSFTVVVSRYLQELALLLGKAPSEIILGVMYYDFPPSVLQIKQNCEKVQALSWLLDMSNDSSNFSKNLKIVMDRFRELYQASLASQKKVKFDGFMGPKSGVEEFRNLVDIIEKIRRYLPGNI